MSTLALVGLVGAVAVVVGFLLGAMAASSKVLARETDVDLIALRAWAAEDQAEVARRERDEMSLALQMSRREAAAAAAERDLERAERLRLEARHETTAIIRKPKPDGHS